MFEWSTLRSLAVVLLAIPVIHLTFILTSGVSRYLDPSPEAWRSELEQIVESDTRLSLPDSPILVVGGQRVRLWRDLAETLAPKQTLLRPLGDATIEDLTYHYDRLIGHYRPDTLIVVTSYADLHVRDSKSPDDFEEALRTLLEMDTSYGSTRVRILLTPVLMPLHANDGPRVRAMAGVARRLQREISNLVVLDPNSLLLNADGRPNPDYYLSDGINLNSEGYARITLLLEQALDSADIPQRRSLYK